jgi:2-dehydro-3-deoxy-L-rhamnonate dehydrogenase (NAD+)
VTGGASGIGAAAVERLRSGGAEVHVFDLTNGDDVRDSAQLDAAVARLPRLDVLVCCAGVAGDTLHTEEVPDDEWARVHAINLNGVFYANRAAIPKMKASGYGRIVNVASIAGKEGNPMAGAYSSSKAAVIGLTKAIGKDVAGSGVSRQLHRAGGDQHTAGRAELARARRLHDRANPARPGGRAPRGRRADLLARERGDVVLDRRLL